MQWGCGLMIAFYAAGYLYRSCPSERMHICPQYDLTNVATKGKLKLKATQQGDSENKDGPPTGLVRCPAVPGWRDTLSGEAVALWPW